MSLATRCAACGTVFRVVQDQLKVSEGWVRCGRCGEVFNALEGLFDLERDAAPAWLPSQRGADDLLPVTADEHQAQSTAAGARGQDGDEDRGEPDTQVDTQADTRADSQIDTRQSDRDEDLDDDAVGRGAALEPDAALPDDGHAAGLHQPTPDFLRQAASSERWQQPRVRQALALAATLLGGLLAAQAVLLQRDAIAARWPPATPLLTALCAPFGCRIEALRRLDSVAVDSSGLTQLDSASLYRLQVTLRNRDQVALLTPALDLTLTDSRGEVVARKVLSGRDFGAATPAQVAAGAELALQVVLDTGERRVTGYSIEIFYP